MLVGRARVYTNKHLGLGAWFGFCPVASET
jgi:hypothetical protein